MIYYSDTLGIVVAPDPEKLVRFLYLEGSPSDVITQSSPWHTVPKDDPFQMRFPRRNMVELIAGLPGEFTCNILVESEIIYVTAPAKNWDAFGIGRLSLEAPHNGTN